MRSIVLPLACAFLLGPGVAAAEILLGVATPLTGPYAWNGEQTRVGAEFAVRDLNAQGGVLGQSVVTVLADDFCDPDQAVAAADKLVAEGVPVVIGHQCSGAALPASLVYEEADVLMISPAATNPRLTERGLRNVFRTCGRDDLQGSMVGDRIARDWPDAAVAIVDDGQAYGQGVALEVGRRLDELGIEAALLAQVEPGQTVSADLIDRFEAAGIEVVFYGGYQAEAGLLVRQAKERLPDLAFVVPDGVASEDFWLIAGPAAAGIPMTFYMDAARQPAAAGVASAFRDAGIDPLGAEFYAYAAVQAWAQAAEQAGTVATGAVAAALRAQEFDTVLGQIGFDEKGDVRGYEPFAWYVWTDGKYVAEELIE